MLKLILSLLTLIVLSNASDYERSNMAAANAFKDLDCEFEDCKEPEVKVVVKEKIVYRDRPVEKVVEKIRTVYVDRPVEVKKVLKPSKALQAGRDYNVLFLDISVPNDPTFISDFVYLTKRAGGLDWNPVKKSCLAAPKRGPYKLKVTGMIELPTNINSDRIYIKPVAGKMTENLEVDGMTWKTAELNMLNAYKNTHVVPFSFTMGWGYYGGDINRFLAEVEKYLPTVRFLISNKPTQRGEKKEFSEARIFINK